MKNLNEVIEKARSAFMGYMDVCSIAKEVIERASEGIEEGNDAYDCVTDSFNDEVVYYCDQWAIVEWYFGGPEDFTSAEDAYNNFIDIIVKCFEE